MQRFITVQSDRNNFWECSAPDQTSTSSLPSLEAQGTLQEMGQKECKNQRMRSAVKYCLSSGHYMAVTYMNWQQLWLFAQDMYKTKPVKILAWDMEQMGMESHRRVSSQPGIPIMIYQMSLRIVWFKGIKDALKFYSAFSYCSWQWGKIMKHFFRLNVSIGTFTALKIGYRKRKNCWPIMIHR